MSNHIPDAGKMVCPKCGSPLKDGWDNVFACGSAQYTEGPLSGVFEERPYCWKLQRDQLRTANAALVERVARLQDECRIAILRADRAEERVKRLEEAGDALFDIAGKIGHGLFVTEKKDAWINAKATS